MAQGIKLPTRLIPFYWYFLRQWKWPFIVLFTVPLFLILELVFLPLIFKEIIDVFASETPSEEAMLTLTHYIALYLFVVAFMYALFRYNEYRFNVAMPWLVATIRTTLFDYVKDHSQRFYNDHFAGSISNRINDVANNTGAVFLDFAWMVIGPLAVLIAAVVMTAQVNEMLALILGVYAAGEILISIYFARRVNRVSKHYAEEVSALSGKLVDIFTNNSPMRLFAAQKREYLRIYDQQEKARRLDQRKWVFSWYRHIISSLTNIAVLIGLFFGCLYLWQHDSISPGEIVFIIVTATNLAMYLFHAGMQLPQLFANIGICQYGLSIVATPHEMTDAPNANALQIEAGAIRFEQVTFQYHEASRAFFQDLSVEIPAGQKVGLVGFSGSGKSSFVNLILRLYDVQSGRILIDGQNVAKVTQQSLHESIAFIPQDTSLFHRSLIDNIRYGRPDANEQEVTEAAKQAHAHAFISELNDGYETLVGERGIKLSGGQRQRIAIARAILKDAPILILDEATASLDSVTEQHIQASLQTLMQGRTTIVIAHRLSTLSDMDRILVFDQGRIIEDGTHNMLLKAGGHYASLWQMQTKGELPEL